MNIEHLPFLAMASLISLVIFWCYKEFSIYRREIIDIKREVIKLKNIIELELHGSYTDDEEEDNDEDDESIYPADLSLIGNPKAVFNKSDESESENESEDDSEEESPQSPQPQQQLASKESPTPKSTSISKQEPKK